MNPALFYGSSLNLVSRIPYDEHESVDSDMPDDEAALRNFLAPDSDNEPNSVGWVTSAPTVIPDSDTDSEDGEDEDDIPLQQRLQAREMTKKKNAAPRQKWSCGNLVKPDNEIRFIYTKEMPMELMQLSIPVQYFKYFITAGILEYILHQIVLCCFQYCSTNVELKRS
jgi:hypothetical protein